MAPTALMAATTDYASLSRTVSCCSVRRPSGQIRVAPSSLSFAQSCELAGSCQALRSTATARASVAVTSARPLLVFAQELRTEQKVKVTLGPYRGKAIKATAPRPKVAKETVDKLLQARLAKTHVFERINFTGSGAKLGHTVKINFEGKYADGPNEGQLVKGTKAAGYELKLEERADEPWKTIVDQIVKSGMGQEESKTFVVRFPVDYMAKPLAGVNARFTVTVLEIGEKKELAKDTRPVEVQRAELESELVASEQRKANDVLDVQIRATLLESSEADVEKVAASVTWAKFGEKSLQDFKWNVVQEEVGRVEGIAFDQVAAFLRGEADINYTD